MTYPPSPIFIPNKAQLDKYITARQSSSTVEVGESLTNLFKGAGIVFIGSVFGKALALLGQILIVRSLSPEWFGTIALAFTIASVTSGVIVLGAPQGIARLLASDSHSKKKLDYLRTGLLISFLGGIMGAVSLYVFRYEIEKLTNTPALAGLLSVFTLFVLVSPVQRAMVGALRGFERPVARVVSKNIAGRGPALLIFMAFAFLRKPFAGAIAYWLFIPLMILITAAYFLQQSINIKELGSRLPRRSTSMEFLSFSWPLIFSSTFVLLMTQLDVLMIGFFLSPDDVGLYRAIQPLKQIVLFFLTSFTFLYLPIATRYYNNGEYDNLNLIYTSTTKWVVTITFPVVLLCILFAEDIIRILFTESYKRASTAFIILIIGMFVRTFVGPNGTTIQAINRTKIEMHASVAGGLTNVAMNVLLIPRVGIEGAAVATGSGFLIYNVIEITIIYRDTGMTPFSRNILKPLLPTAIVGAGIYYLVPDAKVGPGFLAIIAIGLGLTHLVSTAVTRSLDKGDRIMISQLRSYLGIEEPLLDFD